MWMKAADTIGHSRCCHHFSNHPSQTAALTRQSGGHKQSGRPSHRYTLLMQIALLLLTQPPSPKPVRHARGPPQSEKKPRHQVFFFPLLFNQPKQSRKHKQTAQQTAKTAMTSAHSRQVNGALRNKKNGTRTLLAFSSSLNLTQSPSNDP